VSDINKSPEEEKEQESKTEIPQEEQAKTEEKEIEEKKEETKEEKKPEVKEESKKEQSKEDKDSFKFDEMKDRKNELKSRLKHGIRRGRGEKLNGNSDEPPKKQEPKNKFNLKGMILLLFILVLAISFPKMMDSSGLSSEKSVSYTEFMKQANENKFEKVLEKEGYLIGTTKGETSEKIKARMISNRVSQDPKLIEVFEKNKVELSSEAPEGQSLLVTILISWFPMLLLIGVWIFMINKMGRGGSGGGPQIFNMGKSKAKENGEEVSNVTFNDVAGIQEAKQELEEVVDFLREPEKFRRIGAKIPKGVLLLGRPGTGKTLLAKAVAGEAGVPFFSMSGSEFVEMFVGVGASRVRDLFNKARKNAPCIVFIDEIDAVGRKRGSGQGGGNDEREQTLNQLLVEMDGFGVEETIIVIAATNRAEILDKALTRPGRFDRQVMVDAPDITGREAILKIHSKNKKLASDVDLKRIARKTAGFVGADLANMLNEAAILAGRYGRTEITMEDIEEASEKVAYGPAKKSKVMSDKERKLTAYHEGGHALVNALLEYTVPAYKVTIIPRGGAGGYLMQIPTEERSYKTKNEYLADIRVALGGRVAEELILTDVSTGASADIRAATGAANFMVTRVGMSDRVGPILVDATQEGDYYQNRLIYSNETGKMVDDEIRRIIDEALQDVRQLLKDNIDKLHLVANTLLERETITGEELDELVKYGKLLTEEERKEHPTKKEDKKIILDSDETEGAEVVEEEKIEE